MRITQTWSVFLMTVWSLSAFAQQPHCGSSEKTQQLLAANPQLQTVRDNIEKFTARWITENPQNTQRAVVTIPVVVHVVYKTSGENISDAQIQSQINVLNEDFSATNADVTNVPSVWSGLISDTEIQFGLATKSPTGEWTNGIIRTETTVDNWNASDNVKFTSQGGSDAWPNGSYLNIWVCNIGGSFLGFTYPPGISANLDGIVIGHKYFGTIGNISSIYNKGRTTTHEAGHYFDLIHPWGLGANNNSCNASDLISDTPVQQSPNFGCQTFPSQSCSNGPNGDMFMNFMDYSNDACLVFFTEGQNARMQATLNGPRAALLSSDGLMVGIKEHATRSPLSIYPNPSSGIINIQTQREEKQPVQIRVLDMLGKEVFANKKVTLGTSAYQMDVSQLTKGIYMLEIISDNGRSSKKINITD